MQNSKDWQKPEKPGNDYSFICYLQYEDATRR